MRISLTALAVAVVALPLVVASCGSGTPAPTAPTVASTPTPTVVTAPTTSTSTSATPVPSAWTKDLTKEQQIAFMKANVAPRMGKVFQAYDPKDFADFGCVTCHGPEYKEPKQFLPKLTLANGKITAFEKDPKIAKFMAEHVVPEMASALGQKPYDPATHEGFGCAGCHPIEMK